MSEHSNLNVQQHHNDELRLLLATFTDRAQSHVLRHRAMYHLSDFGVAVFEPLLELIQSDDTWVRRSIPIVLGRLHELRGFEPLIQLLSDDDPEVRIASTIGLSALGDPRAVAA